MAIAAYKDLCIDALDPARLGRFWGEVLDLDLHIDDDGDAHLTGPTPAHTIWVNAVPETKTVKHRVHLDVNTASIAALERLGATVLDDRHPWTVMADPEGGEFCAFVRDGAIGRRLYEVSVDTADDPAASHRIAAWWAHVLDARLVDDDEDSYVDRIPSAPFDAMVCAPVPEAKVVKNRIHIDVTADDLDALRAAGAALLRPQDEKIAKIAWSVMADPDGNEFCAFVPV